MTEKRYDLADDESFERFCDARMNKIHALRQVEIDDAIAKAALKEVQDREAQAIKICIATKNWDELPPMWAAAIKGSVDRVATLQKGIKNRNGDGGNMAPAYLVTVNPKPGTELSAFKKKVEKYAKSKMIRSAQWAFEQRGACDVDKGNGMHVHIVVRQRGDYFNGVFCSNTRRAFKNFVGNERHVDIRPLKTEQDVVKACAYIGGDKEDPSKGIKCQFDVSWRQENNLDPMYVRVNIEDDGIQAEESAASPAPEGPSSDDSETDGDEAHA